jgi:ribosomal protein L37E
MDRVLVRCESCGRPYAARTDGERLLLPTEEGSCLRCGRESFAPIDAAAVGPEE